MTIKNILLTGASGTVGIEVLKQLIEKKCYTIYVFDIDSKRSRKLLKSYRKNFKFISGDITNRQDIEKIPDCIDVVIHLAAIIPPVANDKQKLTKKVNIEGTRNLIDELEKRSPNVFFMYSSSISVYGDRIKNPDITKDDPLIPSDGDTYAVTKIISEGIVKNSKLDWTVFRLAAIMGNHKMSKLMFHQPLNTALEIATPQDTARAFVNGIAKQRNLSRQIFNLGGGKECRMHYGNFLERSFEVFGLGKPEFPEHAFADKNFHCGYYADGDILENIVHFRKDSIEDYFKMEAEKTTFLKRVITSALKIPIKAYLLKQSEPYQAKRSNDSVLIEHFFNTNI